MTIKSIETRYAGCRFRSRTEARWAVLLDALGVKWEYEKEGFELPSGRYLPDFWIPEWDSWLEIKGTVPSDAERRLTYELSDATGKRAIIAYGIPEENGEQLESMMILRQRLAEDNRGFVLASDMEWFDSTQPLPYRYVPFKDLTKAHLTPRLKAAINKARSARFEHGEKP